MEVRHEVKSGMDMIDILTKSAAESQSAIREVFSIVRSTEEKSKKINAANEVIKSISDQTNLLAPLRRHGPERPDAVSPSWRKRSGS